MNTEKGYLFPEGLLFNLGIALTIIFLTALALSIFYGKYNHDMYELHDFPLVEDEEDGEDEREIHPRMHNPF